MKLKTILKFTSKLNVFTEHKQAFCELLLFFRSSFLWNITMKVKTTEVFSRFPDSLSMQTSIMFIKQLFFWKRSLFAQKKKKKRFIILKGIKNKIYLTKSKVILMKHLSLFCFTWSSSWISLTGSFILSAHEANITGSQALNNKQLRNKCLQISDLQSRKLSKKKKNPCSQRVEKEK